MPEHTQDDFQARSLQGRRQKLVDEMAQMQRAIDHWNRTHPNEEPIVMSWDLTAEVEALKEVRKNG